MLRLIVQNVVALVHFIAQLDLSLSKPQQKHVLNLADAILVEEGRKTISALNRRLLEAPDESSVAHCLNASPWQASDLRQSVLKFVMTFAIGLTRRCHLEQIITISIDDAICEKHKDTKHIEGVAWHHDHLASTKKQPRYKNGSAYIVCHIKIGFISFAVNWRLYLREKTVRQLNRQREPEERLHYLSKERLVRMMLLELLPFLPDDFQAYVLADSWYSSAKLIKFCRKHLWHYIGGLKANRCLSGIQLQEWRAKLQHSRYTSVALADADGQVTVYQVRSVIGRLNDINQDVCVIFSKRHKRAKQTNYFVCTDTSLSAQQALETYQGRWFTEVDHFYLKTRLGLADYQVRAYEAVEKWHAICFLVLAYLQYRRVHGIATRLAAGQAPGALTLADLIRQHRHEHQQLFLAAAARFAIKSGSIQAVLQRFLSSPAHSYLSPEVVA